MPRAVPEWQGKTDDSPIPDRVKTRIFLRDNGRCQECTRKVGANVGLAFAFDHIKALVNGGKHSEANLRLICTECHKAKSAEDVAEKSHVYHVAAKHIGTKKTKGRPLPGTKASGLRKRMNGQVERRT